MLKLCVRRKVTRKGTVSKTYYVTIPSDVVRALGWSEGDLLDMKVIPISSGQNTMIALLVYKVGQ